MALNNKLFVLVPKGAQFNGINDTLNSPYIWFCESTGTIWAKGKEFGAGTIKDDSGNCGCDMDTLNGAISGLVSQMAGTESSGLKTLATKAASDASDAATAASNAATAASTADSKAGAAQTTANTAKSIADANALAIKAIQDLLGVDENGDSTGTAGSTDSIVDQIESINSAIANILSVNANDSILSVNNNTISSVINFGISSDKKSIVLTGRNNTAIGSVLISDIVSDGMVETVAWGTGENANSLVVTWNTAAGKQAVNIPMDKLIDDYTSGSTSQLTVSDRTITVNYSDDFSKYVGLTGDAPNVAASTGAIDTGDAGKLATVTGVVAAIRATESSVASRLNNLKTSLNTLSGTVGGHTTSIAAIESMLNDPWEVKTASESAGE